MIHKLHYPQPPLSNFVENSLFVSGNHPEHTREKLLPDGAIELIIDLDPVPKKLFENENSPQFRSCKKAWISGERTRYIIIGSGNTCMIGIRFRPGGAYPFFSFPISELNDSVIDLDLILGGLVDEIRDQLLEADSPEARFLLLEAFLLGHVRRSLEVNRLITFAVHQLQHSPQFLAIRDLASTIGITQKHLISQFEKIVGLRPKSFARVAKFHKVLKTIEQRQQI